MMRLAGFTEPAYALLRIVAGLLFTFHGVQKVFGLFTDHRPGAWTQLWIGGVLELLLGFAVALGLQTRLAAFLASGMMAVAYVQFHWRFQLGAAFWPAVNKGEPAVVYAFLFLFMACRGAGIWGLDRKE